MLWLEGEEAEVAAVLILVKEVMPGHLVVMDILGKLLSLLQSTLAEGGEPRTVGVGRASGHLVPQSKLEMELDLLQICHLVDLEE